MELARPVFPLPYVDFSAVKYSAFSLLAVDSGTFFSKASEKCRDARVGPFSAAYFPIFALSVAE